MQDVRKTEGHLTDEEAQRIQTGVILGVRNIATNDERMAKMGNTTDGDDDSEWEIGDFLSTDDVGHHNNNNNNNNISVLFSDEKLKCFKTDNASRLLQLL